MGERRQPRLWHIPVSHFSEKARWALDFKGVEHERRAPPPGVHMGIALALTGGRSKTFPVLELDGRRIGDSTAIIDALEQAVPEPALYPENPELRARALELEEYFDERLGPQIRLLGWHELRRDPERMAEVAAATLPGPVAGLAPTRALGGRLASTYVSLRYRVADEDAAEEARTVVAECFDRLERELGRGEGDYLIGSSFSVADLTAASLFYPLVMPEGAPRALRDRTERFAAYCERFEGREGYRYIERMYARHRRGSAETAARTTQHT